MTRKIKPRIFIGSSAEALHLVEALISHLGNHDFVLESWTGDVFTVTGSTMHSLVKALDRADFGVFLFHQDDEVEFRGKSMTAARDNTVLEYGMYLGRLGPERTIGVLPRDLNQKMPSDTDGLSFVSYDPNDIDNIDEDNAALTKAATDIKRHVRNVGPLATAEHNDGTPGQAVDSEYLNVTVQTATRNTAAPTDGWTFMLDMGLLTPVDQTAAIRLGQILIHALHGAGRVVGIDPKAAGGSVELRLASGTGFYSLESEVLYLPPSGGPT